MHFLSLLHKRSEVFNHSPDRRNVSVSRVREKLSQIKHDYLGKHRYYFYRTFPVIILILLTASKWKKESWKIERFEFDAIKRKNPELQINCHSLQSMQSGITPGITHIMPKNMLFYPININGQCGLMCNAMQCNGTLNVIKIKIKI